MKSGAGASPSHDTDIQAAVEQKERIESGVIHVSEVLYYLDLDRFLSKREASKFIGLSERTLEGVKDLPKYRPTGKTLYRKRELIEWAERYRERSFDEIKSLVDSVLQQVESGERCKQTNIQSTGHSEDK